ncbi:MAG: hypothetical protein JWN93_1195 [Hyphomicrobiales bacterium]|jgi:hypothetical protein|nr:hypothetical protein [Hyphomicrobiales bacterium]
MKTTPYVAPREEHLVIQICLLVGLLATVLALMAAVV